MNNKKNQLRVLNQFDDPLHPSHNDLDHYQPQYRDSGHHQPIHHQPSHNDLEHRQPQQRDQGHHQSTYHQPSHDDLDHRQRDQGHHQPNRAQDHQEHSPTKQHVDNDFEIIRQGYGITQPMRADIIEAFRTSHTQKEYKNPADFMKHKLDQKYGPFWFVFMWEDKKSQTAQYSYYNNDDRVFEFKAQGWQILIYSFNQTVEREVFAPSPHQRVITPPRQMSDSRHSYSHVSQYRPQYQLGDYWGGADPYYEDYYDNYYRPHFPYPSLMQRPYQYRPRWYQG